MKTVPLQNPWGEPIATEGLQRYAPKHPHGKRVPGWEDCNVALLAKDMGMSHHYMLGVIRGQRNCTLALLQRLARLLGIDIATLIGRMEHAYKLRLEEAANSPGKSERRRQRNEQRALQSQAL